MEQPPYKSGHCLHQSVSGYKTLYRTFHAQLVFQAETLVDVTLAAGGRHLQAHKVVLSACSEYFQSVFASNPCQVKAALFISALKWRFFFQHPVVIMKDVDFEDLETVVKFMYHGIVNVSSDKLPAVLNTADALQIKGLEKTNELMASVLSSSTRSSQVVRC